VIKISSMKNIFRLKKKLWRTVLPAGTQALAAAIACSCACAQTTPKLVAPAPVLLPSSKPSEPLAAGPLGWKLLGEQIYAAPGSDGLYHVAYALVFTSEYHGAVTIKSIEVLDPDKNFQPTGTNLMLSIKNENITAQVRPFALPATFDAANFSTELAPGAAGVVYFDVTYRDRNSIPAHLSHRVSTSVTAGGKTVDFVVVDDPIAVDGREPIVLRPPLRGSGWVNANGCCQNLGPHRATFNPINGVFWQSETFAIDFVAVDPKGIGHTGDGSKVDQYFYYGADILAAKGGKVIEVVTDMPDQIPNTDPAGITLDTAAGNHVIIEMGKDRYALYAHLKPHSATVQVGDIVVDGQKLGLLGNTGSTTGPHLHFQVMDRPSPLKANGVPFVFDSFLLSGTVTDSVDGTGGKFSGGSPLQIRNVGNPQRHTMPLALDVLNFP
jgi:murein DD-endopeptidase MepM/ murein hydrolase activator NlpD